MFHGQHPLQCLEAIPEDKTIDFLIIKKKKNQLPDEMTAKTDYPLLSLFLFMIYLLFALLLSQYVV